MTDGKPNLNGVWESIGTANWDLQDHSPAPGPIWQLGAIGSDPRRPGRGRRQRDPVQARRARTEKEEQGQLARRGSGSQVLHAGDPARDLQPFPFQIIQSNKDILMAYEFASANRLINMGKPIEAGSDTWMGTSNGHWEGDTLVVDVTGLNGLSWFDRAGNYASDKLHVVERYNRRSNDVMDYEATIEDPSVFTRPWKISLPLYKRAEKNAQILEFKCVEFAEELLYGKYKKQPTKYVQVKETPYEAACPNVSDGAGSGAGFRVAGNRARHWPGSRDQSQEVRLHAAQASLGRSRSSGPVARNRPDRGADAARCQGGRTSRGHRQRNSPSARPRPSEPPRTTRCIRRQGFESRHQSSGILAGARKAAEDHVAGGRSAQWQNPRADRTGQAEGRAGQAGQAGARSQRIAGKTRACTTAASRAA